jgi:hypothetical protein
MPIDFQTHPVNLFYCRPLPGEGEAESETDPTTVVLATIGEALVGHIAKSEISTICSVSVPELCSTQAPLLAACKSSMSIVVITDSTTPTIANLAESIAGLVAHAGQAPALWVNLCESTNNVADIAQKNTVASAFAVRIVPLGSAPTQTDWLNAVLFELVLLHTGMSTGFVGVDVHDLITTIGSETSPAIAIVGWGKGSDSASRATEDALESLGAAGIDVGKVSGIASLLTMDLPLVSQMRKAINVIRDKCSPEATVIHNCHSYKAKFSGARVVMFVRPQ